MGPETVCRLTNGLHRYLTPVPSTVYCPNQPQGHLHNSCPQEEGNYLNDYYVVVLTSAIMKYSEKLDMAHICARKSRPIVMCTLEK